MIGAAGGISVIIELVFLHILSNYRSVKLKKTNQKLIIEVSELNRVIYKQEIRTIKYWWSYNLISNKTSNKSNFSGTHSSEEIPGYSSAKGNLEATSAPLPRTIYLEVNHNERSIILYESLYTLEKIPQDWEYNNSYREEIIEAYKIEILVKNIIDNLQKQNIQTTKI